VIEELLAEHLAKKSDHGNRLWLLCNSEMWYRMSIEGWTKEMVKERLVESHVRPVDRVRSG